MTRFVGRTFELDVIESLLGADGSAAAIVLGEPGVGKTRLLGEAAAQADAPTFRVVGYESESLVPLAAAGELIRRLASASEYGPVLDEVAFRSSATGDPVRIFEAAHRALSSVGDAVLIVDDLQWLDDLSAGLVHYLMRGASASGDALRLIGAGRNTDRSFGFVEEIERLLPPSRRAVLELAPLGAGESLELALSLDPDLEPEKAALIGERSAGVPFWIETLVHFGEAVADTSRLLTGRLRGAGPDPPALLALLAVAARPLYLEDVADLQGWSPERAAAAVDNLVSRGIASRTAGAVRVAHDLLRETAFSQLPDRTRRQLHRRLAEWLEQAAEEDVSILREALVHRVAAGDKPIELAVRLVSSPQRRLLGHEGVRELAAVADDTDASTADGQTLRTALAELSFELGDHRLALERWAAVASSASVREMRFEALLGASKAAFRLGWEYAERAHQFADQAVACAQTEEELVVARAHEARILLWLDHDTPGGATAAREALERSRCLTGSCSASRIRLDALHAARDVAMQENDGIQMAQVAEEMLTVVREEDDAYVDALLVVADAQTRTGPLGEAADTGRIALVLAKRRVLPLQAAEAGQNLAGKLHDQGRLDEAASVARESEELALRAEYVRPMRLIAREVALVCGECELEQGLQDYDREVRSRPDPHIRIWPRGIAANLLSRARGGRGANEVAALLTRAQEDAAAAGCPRCTNVLHVAAAEALARVGRTQDAEDELRRAEAVPPRDAMNRLRRLYACGMVAAGSDPTAAALTLEQVREEADRLEHRLDGLWAGIDLARIAGAQEREHAATLLRDVAAGADSIGAALIRDVAEHELRRLGVRTWRRGATASPGALTKREREVAELVARGASNPEIAEALFLSRKTVERHVSNVLAKVGARNRVELAGMLAREARAPRR